MDLVITETVIEITELQNTHSVARAKRQSLLTDTCEGVVGGSFDIVKRRPSVPFDPHPGEEQISRVNSG
jgi:hypothetical protein